MREKYAVKLHIISTFLSAMILFSLMTGFLFTSKLVLGLDQVTGAIWTTDPNGERINGNLYKNARSVYLAGGPHKRGAAGLQDGSYYFQVTDPSGKMLLSADSLEDRRFTVENGYITSIGLGTHKWNPDTTRGLGIVVQLWPFAFSPKRGGVYKVWVTKEGHYDPFQGRFGFLPSLSKTDNFKVKLDEEPKYFELWVTDEISNSQNVAFYVNYTTDKDGDTGTFDPVLPWTTGQLLYDRHEGGYDVFRYETTFALGSYIYWRFSLLDSFMWLSDLQGPELISNGGMVNKEFMFRISGHKYNYPDNTGLADWTVSLFKDNVKIEETQTSPNGYYEFIGVGLGDYRVCETNKTDEGWAPYGPTCYEFTIDEENGSDHTFDFYNYKMLGPTDSSDNRLELPSFDVVFTPSDDGSGKYKLSSTNPGSFYLNIAKYGEAYTPVRLEVDLPTDGDNAYYDSPNFLLHHTYKGNSSLVDIHVYEGKLVSSNDRDWIPDWSTDVTHLFNITASVDGKHAAISGNMTHTGLIFVTVHMDYQIIASLSWEQVQTFNDFKYTFSVQVYASIFGVTKEFSVGQAK